MHTHRFEFNGARAFNEAIVAIREIKTHLVNMPKEKEKQCTWQLVLVATINCEVAIYNYYTGTPYKKFRMENYRIN